MKHFNNLWLIDLPLMSGYTSYTTKHHG